MWTSTETGVPTAPFRVADATDACTANERSAGPEVGDGALLREYPDRDLEVPRRVKDGGAPEAPQRPYGRLSDLGSVPQVV